jgi:hypothetical protein
MEILNIPEELRRIWRQEQIPVIVRKGAGFPLQLKVPFPKPDDFEWRRATRAWLQQIRPRGRSPEWKSKTNGFELPQSWFDDLVSILLRRYGKLYIIQPYREQEKCASKCMNAQGHECQCSCMGANHGQGGPDGSWFEVSETFATRWGEQHLACRLMTKK